MEEAGRIHSARTIRWENIRISLQTSAQARRNNLAATGINNRPQASGVGLRSRPQQLRFARSDACRPTAVPTTLSCAPRARFQQPGASEYRAGKPVLSNPCRQQWADGEIQIRA